MYDLLYVVQVCVAVQVHCTPLWHTCNATTMHPSSDRRSCPSASATISWTPEEMAFYTGVCSEVLVYSRESLHSLIFSPAFSPPQHFPQRSSTLFWHKHALCKGLCLCVTGSAPCLNWSCGSVVQGWGCLVAGRWPCHYSSDSAGSFLAWTAEPALPWIYSDLPWAEDSWQSGGGERTQVKLVEMWVCLTSADKRYAKNTGWLQTHV